MALHGGTPYPQALNGMTLSEARAFFASKAFAGYRSTLEGRQRVTMAIISRFDHVLKGIGILGKILSTRRP